jgi:CRISPR-associated protein Csh1
MIQEIINFVDTLPDEVFASELKPKEGFYILLDIDENGNLTNVDENGKINSSDIEKYLEKEEAENDLSEHLTLCKNIYLNSQVMGKGPNKSFNSSLKIFSTVATPFGIGLRKGVFNADKQTLERKTKAINDYFKAAKAFVGQDASYQEWFRRFELFCKKHLLNVVKQHEFMRDDTKENPNKYGIKDTEFVHFFLRSPKVAAYKAVNQVYFAERIFNEDKETSKGKFGVYANTHVLNESKVFLRHITGLTPSIKWLSGEDAAKVEQFYAIQKFLPKPFPLFVYEEERQDLIKVFKEDSKIKYSEIVRKLTKDGKDELHNYYLIFFGGADYSRVIDIDFVSTFQFSTDILTKKIFPLHKDDINSQRINDVFEFEQEVVKPILNIHPDNYINYFGEEKFDTKYTTHNYYNQFLKYRKAFFDYIYKSKREAISQRMFDDILLKGILDDIRTDEYTVDKDRNENRLKILTKLNIWFSLYNYFHSSNYKKSIDMISKIEKHRNKVDEIITQNALINSVDEFAYLAGQCIGYLFSKSETSDKSYNRLETFLQKTDCRLLQKAMANFFAMYKHKEVTNKFGKVFAQVMDYETTENVKDYLPEFLAGFFDNNQLFSEQKTDNNN